MKTNKKNNTDWELEAPTLASLPKKTPFKIPNGYFNKLTTQLNNGIFLQNLAKIKKQSFSTPPNYFKALGPQIQSKIASQSRTYGPSNLVKNNSFKTPANYFKNLQTNILNKTANQTKKTKVLRLWQLNITKYAAAACFVLVAFTTALYFNQQKTATPSRTYVTAITTEQLLYDIDENTIIEHVSLAQQTETLVPKAELENYILNHYNTTDLTTDL